MVTRNTKPRAPVKRAPAKRASDKSAILTPDNRIREFHLDVLASREYYKYGVATIEDRAIFGDDGLKPVARKILWAAHKLGIQHTSKAEKSAKVVGECFVLDTPIRMADGSDRGIQDVHVGEQVFTRDGSLGEVVAEYIMPPKPLFEITANGKSVSGTEDQKFMILRAGVEMWVPASEIRVGDMIEIL